VRIDGGKANLSDYNDVETKHLGNAYHLTGLRLSCQARVMSGAVRVELVVKPKKP